MFFNLCLTPAAAATPTVPPGAVKMEANVFYTARSLSLPAGLCVVMRTLYLGADSSSALELWLVVPRNGTFNLLSS